jgi:NTE family protein
VSALPIARASAASAALPLALSPISYKNYAGSCGFEVPTAAAEAALKRGGASAQRAKEYLSYLDVTKRGYIHLLDGGLSDSMALRALLEGSTVAGGIEHLMRYWGVKNVKKFVILAVGAETSPDVMDFGGDQIPSLFKAMSSLVDVPINRYSADSVSLMRIGVKLVREELAKRPRPPDSPFADDAEIYFMNASLSEVEDPDERESLMRIPTTLHLTDGQIDRLLRAASRLIRNDPEFQRLMTDLQGNP